MRGASSGIVPGAKVDRSGGREQEVWEEGSKRAWEEECIGDSRDPPEEHRMQGWLVWPHLTPALLITVQILGGLEEWTEDRHPVLRLWSSLLDWELDRGESLIKSHFYPLPSLLPPSLLLLPLELLFSLALP